MLPLLLACTQSPPPDCTAQSPAAPWGYAARWPDGPAEALVDGQRLELFGQVTPHREGRLLEGLTQTLTGNTLVTWGSAIIHDNDQKMAYHRATTTLTGAVAQTRLEQVDWASGKTCLLAEGTSTLDVCGDVRRVQVVLTPAEACLPRDAPVVDCPPLPDIPDSADLVPFAPRRGFGFLDLPINGETASNQHRSHLRADLAVVIQRAAMESRCRSQSWPASNDAPLVLGDMSLADGTTPACPTAPPPTPQAPTPTETTSTSATSRPVSFPTTTSARSVHTGSTGKRSPTAPDHPTASMSAEPHCSPASSPSGRAPAASA